MEGPAAWDFWTAFEQHWRHQLSEHVEQLLRLDQVGSCTSIKAAQWRQSKQSTLQSSGCSCVAFGCCIAVVGCSTDGLRILFIINSQSKRGTVADCGGCSLLMTPDAACVAGRRPGAS